MRAPSHKNSSILIPVLVAIIGAIALIVAALVQRKSVTDRTSLPTLTVGAGRLAGVLTDRSGEPISDMSVSVRQGPETRTDGLGKFVLNNLPSGDQLIEVQSPSKKGNLTQTIRIEPKQTTSASIVYDANTSRLGLLSITAPVDGSLLELHRDGNEHRAIIYGKCDGLTQTLDQFDIWVLISSERDSRFWVQHPPAVVDPNSNTWRAKVLFGSIEHPPQDAEHWDIVAVAASSESETGRVLNTPTLSMLPPHIKSNVVTVETKIIR